MYCNIIVLLYIRSNDSQGNPAWWGGTWHSLISFCFFVNTVYCFWRWPTTCAVSSIIFYYFICVCVYTYIYTVYPAKRKSYLKETFYLILHYRSNRTSLADEHVIMFASLDISRESYRPSPRSLFGAEPMSVEKFRQEKVPLEILHLPATNVFRFNSEVTVKGL